MHDKKAFWETNKRSPCYLSAIFLKVQCTVCVYLPCFYSSVQFSHSVVITKDNFLFTYLDFPFSLHQCLCDPLNCTTPGFPVHHQLPELAQTHVHRVGDAIQPTHPLSSSSPPTFNLSQYQGLFQWVSSPHQVTKVLELQLQSFQWIFRTDFL